MPVGHGAEQGRAVLRARAHARAGHRHGLGRSLASGQAISAADLLPVGQQAWPGGKASWPVPYGHQATGGLWPEGPRPVPGTGPALCYAQEILC